MLSSIWYNKAFAYYIRLYRDKHINKSSAYYVYWPISRYLRYQFLSVSYQDKRMSFISSLIAKSSRCARCSSSNWVQNEVVGPFWKRKISLLALLFVVNRSAIFCKAVLPMSMKRVINQNILSLLYTIIFFLIKMHQTTSSSDVCDVENILTWHCVEQKHSVLINIGVFVHFMLLKSISYPK